MAHRLASVQHAGDTSALGRGPASRSGELREVMQRRLLVHGHYKHRDMVLEATALALSFPSTPWASLLEAKPEKYCFQRLSRKWTGPDEAKASLCTEVCREF